MSDLNDRRTAETVISAVETVAARAITRQTPQTIYGVVFGPPDTTKRHVAVRLRGQAEPSPGFVYGSATPKDGDLVRVVISPRGDRFVDDVLGRDIGSGVVPTVTTLPTASEAYRGRMLFLANGVGVADQAYICRKKADETYEWAAVL